MKISIMCGDCGEHETEYIFNNDKVRCADCKYRHFDGLVIESEDDSVLDAKQRTDQSRSMTRPKPTSCSAD